MSDYLVTQRGQFYMISVGGHLRFAAELCPEIRGMVERLYNLIKPLSFFSFDNGEKLEDYQFDPKLRVSASGQARMNLGQAAFSLLLPVPHNNEDWRLAIREIMYAF